MGGMVIFDMPQQSAQAIQSALDVVARDLKR